MPSHKPSGPASAAEPAAPVDPAGLVPSVRPASEPGGGGAPVRVLIVDDHPAVRFGLRLLLEREGMTVAGEADCMAAARQLAADSRPDLAIVDLSLGDEDGLELLAELGRSEPELALLVYSMHEDAEHIQLALGAGAQLRAPMARAVVGGLITSTLLTLIVIPVFFDLLDGFSLKGLWGRVRRH